MIIGNDFYLSGFTRFDKGEAGAVFVRYAENAERKPEIADAYLYHGGDKFRSFTLSVPLPTPVACAVVTRTSKNHFQATVYDEARIEMLRAESLNGLRSAVLEFFERGKKYASRAR